MSKSKPNTKKLKASIPTLEGDGCQFEVYSKGKKAMVVCGQVCYYENKLVYNVCDEHYRYMTQLGFKPKLRKKK